MEDYNDDQYQNEFARADELRIELDPTPRLLKNLDFIATDYQKADYDTKYYTMFFKVCWDCLKHRMSTEDKCSVIRHMIKNTFK